MADSSGLSELRKKLAASAAKGVTAESACESVNAVYDFLLGQGCIYQELRPLLGLLAAFEDHAKGKPNAIFAIKRRPGQRAPAVKSMFKSCVAATVEALMLTGEKKRRLVIF